VGRECEFAGAGSLPFGCAMPPPSAIRTSLADAPGPRRSASDPGMQELRAPEPQRPRTTGAVVDPVAVKKNGSPCSQREATCYVFSTRVFQMPSRPRFDPSIHRQSCFARATYELTRPNDRSAAIVLYDREQRVGTIQDKTIYRRATAIFGGWSSFVSRESVRYKRTPNRFKYV
jgi:hypothetical protein